MKNYSFIIPHHNCPELLNRLVDSIPQRDDIEIIVIDDNSSVEKQPKVTRSDVNVILLSAKESRGAGHARNIGLDCAQGKWLLFADSDDYYEDGFIYYIDEHVNNDTLDIIVFNAYSIDSKTKIKTEVLNKAFRDFTQSRIGENFSRKILMSSTVPWNKIYRRDFVKNCNARFEEVPFGNDLWFTQYTASAAENIVAVNKCIYNWEITESGITSRKRKLSDYLKCLSTHRRTNKFKYKYGFYDLIAISGMFKYSILKNYPFYVYALINTYYFFTDNTVKKVFLRKKIINPIKQLIINNIKK